MLDANQIAETVRAQDADPEVSASTLHYYVQVGILPPAVGRGRNSYTPEHLNRFRLARYLRREGLGLPQIREQLKDLSSTAVTAELLQRGSPGTPSRLAGAKPRMGAAPTSLRSGFSMPLSRSAPAAEAPSGRPKDSPRTLRFRGGFSLQVPPGASDEQISRLYTAVEAVLHEEVAPEQEPEQEVQE
jgi:DNA-binding transcriptional MerR regulator